jgi:hypothetical protein
MDVEHPALGANNGIIYFVCLRRKEFLLQIPTIRKKISPCFVAPNAHVEIDVKTVHIKTVFASTVSPFYVFNSIFWLYFMFSITNESALGKTQSLFSG